MWKQDGNIFEKMIENRAKKKKKGLKEEITMKKGTHT